MCGGVTLQQVDGLVVKSGLCEIECVFDVDVGCAAHQSLHFLQYVVVVREKILLEAASHVEAVYLERFRYQVEGFFLTSQVAQDGSFQLACLVVVPVAHERAVYQVESFLEVAPAAVDGSQVVIGGILPSGIPSRFEESVVRLVRFVLHQTAPTQIVIRFTVVRVRIAFRQGLDGFTEITFSLGELSLAHQEQPHGVVATHVARFAVQRFLIVVHRVVSRVAVLLQVQSRQEKLLGGRDVLRVFGGFGRIRYGLDLRFVGLIAYQDTAFMVADFNQDVFVFQALGCKFCLERFCRRDGDDFVEKGGTAHVVLDEYMHVLVHSGGVQDDFAFALLDFHVQQRVLGGILHVAHLGVRHEVLFPRLFLVGLQPSEVRLVVGVHARHQFDVRAVLVRQVAVPCASEVAVSPCPLLLSRRHVMVGHVEQSAFHVFFIASYEVEFRLDGHV